MYILYLVIIFVIILQLCNGENSDGPDCRNVTTGKKPGYTHLYPNNAATHARHDKVYTVNNTDLCIDKCIEDVGCQMADFEETNSSCRLYSSISEFRPKIGHSLFTWIFCNLSNASNFKQGAPGFMMYSVDRYRPWIHNLRRLTLEFTKCRQECFDLDLCGGFNYFHEDNTCELLVIWNYVYQRLDYKRNCTTYYWVLQDPITYRINNDQCQQIASKPCAGKWLISTKINTDNNVMIVFKTRNFSLCYNACEYYSNCGGVVYHFKISLCELKPFIRKPCVKAINITRRDWINVEWICCNIDREIQTQLRVHPRSSGEISCGEITQPLYVTLIPFNCSYPPTTVSENCLTLNKVVSIDCHYHQAFQSLNVWWKGYLKVFNGYQEFWLKNATEINFPGTQYPPCEIYNATIPRNPRINLIRKYDWFGESRNQVYVQFTGPVKFVIVGVLSHPNCLCFVWLHCAEVLREKQFVRSLQSHFYIGGKYVFKNIGWTNQSKKINGDYSENSLYVDFLGDYMTNAPSFMSLIAFRNLVAYGVARRYISEHYTLLTYHDINPDQSKDFKLIYSIIRTLSRYNGTERANCRQISSLIIILNGLTILITVIVTLFFTINLYRFTHNNGCTMLRNISIDHRFCKVELNDFSSKADFLTSTQFNNIFFNNNDSLRVSNCSVFWITEMLNTSPCPNCMKAIQETLRLSQIRKKSIKLNNFKQLNMLCDKSTTALTFKKQSILCKTVVIFLHLRNENLFHNFQSIFANVTSGRCVCSNYRINYLDSEPLVSKVNNV